VFENVIHNAPLAIRALADQGMGIDERKWRKIRREIRKNEKTDVKGKGAIEGQRMKENIQDEFAQYFSVPQVAEDPVSLCLVLDPEIPFASTSSSSPLPAQSIDFDASYRLLPPSVLSVFEHFTQSYTSHANRLRSLINRLSSAGLLDDPSALETGMYLDQNTGKRIWKVTFYDGFLTRGRLEGILRDDIARKGMNSASWEEKVKNWNNGARSQGRGEGEWWWIAGGTPSTFASSLDLETLYDPTPSTYLHSPLESTYSPSASGSSTPLIQFTPSQSLVLPDPSCASVSSLDLSPPLSPSLEPTTWTSFSATASEFAFDGPELRDFEAIESWSNGFEDEMTEEEGSTIEWSDAEEGEMNGVKEFLEEVERERKRLGESGWR